MQGEEGIILSTEEWLSEQRKVYKGPITLLEGDVFSTQKKCAKGAKTTVTSETFCYLGKNTVSLGNY